MIIYLKRLKSSKFVRMKAFPMYGGIGVSAPSLHRESTDSLIYVSSLAAQAPFEIGLLLYVMTYLGCGLDRVERSERPKFGVLDLPMHADLISSDGIHVVARSS